MSAKLIVATFVSSLVASILSVIIIFATSMVAISSSGAEEERRIDAFVHNNIGKVITEKEAEESDMLAKIIIDEKIIETKERDGNLGFSGGIKEAKERAKFFTWTPWLLLPFFVSFSQWRWGFLLLLLPLLLSFTIVFFRVEVIAFGSFVFLGDRICRYFRIARYWSIGEFK